MGTAKKCEMGSKWTKKKLQKQKGRKPWDPEAQGREEGRFSQWGYGPPHPKWPSVSLWKGPGLPGPLTQSDVWRGPAALHHENGDQHCTWPSGDSHPVLGRSPPI